MSTVRPKSTFSAGKPVTKYEVRWRDDNNVQRKKLFAKKWDAVQFQRNIDEGLERGTYVNPAKGNRTFEDYFVNDWLPRQQVEKNQYDNYCSHFRHLGEIRAMRLSSIRKQDIETLIAKLRERVSAQTIHTYMCTPRAVLTAAAEERYITESPFSRVRLPRVPKKLVRPLEIEPVKEIIAVADENIQAICYVATLAGMRQGEIFALRWSDVTLGDRPALSVSKQIQPLKEGGRGVCMTKTKVVREVPIGRRLLTCLEWHVDTFGLGPEGAIFVNNEGKWWHKRVFSRRYLSARSVVADNYRQLAQSESDPRRVAELNDIATRILGKPGVFHYLRHFYASRLIAGGASVKEVQQRLGHASAAMTLNTYAHLFEQADERTREITDSIF